LYIATRSVWLEHGSGVKIEKPRTRVGNGKEIDLARYVSTDARLYKDERGVLWISKTDRNIYRLDLNGNGALTVESFPIDSYYLPYTHMIGDGAGGLWLGTVEKIGRLRGGRYSLVEPSAGLPETDPRALFLDSRGWLWVGLRYKGVSVTRERAADNPTSSITRTNRATVEQPVRSIAKTGGPNLFRDRPRAGPL
jgi:ligand-binding sensor domain-containing protein